MILINIIEEKKIKNVDKEIPNISGSLKKTGFNSKITEAENKIRRINRSFTSSLFNIAATEIKIKYLSVD